MLGPSPFRPHVLARNRIAEWKTPFSYYSLASLAASFPPEVIQKWHNVVLASVEPDTRANYGAGLLRFNQFCDQHNILEDMRMPASEATLSLFISSVGAGHVASGTVGSWLSGLQLWHQLNGAPWLGGEILLRTKKGVSKLAPPSSRRLPRDPVSFNHMLVLRDVLNLSNTLDSAIWAAATSAWRGCARLGELLVLRALALT
ncbi:hypothetical protein FB451DRAFT_1023570 [Mycena latifolia]|nr:hypothetical protein FB451DRAFT_1023570 [Mycena latifolia]